MDNCQVSNKYTKNKLINRIIFNTIYHGTPNSVIVDKDRLLKWRNSSEYIDVLMGTYHECETLHLNLQHVVDLDCLMIIFNYFDTGKISNVDTEQKDKIINGLGYFGINSDTLNSIRKGYGMVWKLHPIDMKIKEDENILFNKINEMIKENKDTNTIKNIDNDIIMNKTTYNELYEKIYSNYSVIKKLYETPNTMQKIYPEFDLSFIVQEFEKLSNRIFDDIDDCIVTGGMVNKHFTYNGYFVDTDYDVFLFTQSETRAIEIIKTIYERMNSKFKTYILKTKNTITLYNNNYEVQIITKLYHNITEILCNFDLDCCCVGYSKGILYALPRFVRSLAYSGNILDPDRYSASYIHRLKKYNKRDYMLYIPGMKKNDPDYNKDNYIMRNLREKTDKYDKNSYYCDLIVIMKNRDNKEIKQMIEHLHSKNQYLDTYEIDNIASIHITDVNKCNINWKNSNNFNKNDKFELYCDMYNSIYIR